MDTVAALRRCTGCRACELACSFRSTGSFWPAASAIQVREAYLRDGLLFRLEVEPGSCDLCSNEALPHCQVVCAPRVLDRGLIADLRGGDHGR